MTSLTTFFTSLASAYRSHFGGSSSMTPYQIFDGMMSRIAPSGGGGDIFIFIIAIPRRKLRERACDMGKPPENSLRNHSGHASRVVLACRRFLLAELPNGIGAGTCRWCVEFLDWNKILPIAVTCKRRAYNDRRIREACRVEDGEHVYGDVLRVRYMANPLIGGAA